MATPWEGRSPLKTTETILFLPDQEKPCLLATERWLGNVSGAFVQLEREEKKWSSAELRRVWFLGETGKTEFLFPMTRQGEESSWWEEADRGERQWFQSWCEAGEFKVSSAPSVHHTPSPKSTKNRHFAARIQSKFLCHMDLSGSFECNAHELKFHWFSCLIILRGLECCDSLVHLSSESPENVVIGKQGGVKELRLLLLCWWLSALWTLTCTLVLLMLGVGEKVLRESVKLPSAMCGVHHLCVNALDQKLWHQRAWSYRWLKLHPVVPTFKTPNNLNHHHRNAIVSLLRHCVERALPWWRPNLFFEVISEGLGLARRELGTHKLWCKFTWFKNYI